MGVQFSESIWWDESFQLGMDWKRSGKNFIIESKHFSFSGQLDSIKMPKKFEYQCAICDGEFELKNKIEEHIKESHGKDTEILQLKDFRRNYQKGYLY